MNLSLKFRVMLPMLAAFVIVGCIRLTDTSKPEVTEFAPQLADDQQFTPLTPTVGAFKVKFETSKGDVVIQVHPEWAPLGSAHFKKLVEAGIYDEARFFRVVPGFMAQFGIAGDPKLQEKYREAVIPDDPVVSSNTRSKITFATSGPNSRSTQLFINYGDNARLDAQGFSPFGEVISGMEFVDAIESKHGETPDQGMLQAKGNEYLAAKFPDLDYIKKATIFDEQPAPAPAPASQSTSQPTPPGRMSEDRIHTIEMPPSEPIPGAADDPAMKKKEEKEEVIRQPEEVTPVPTSDTPTTDKPAEKPATPTEP